MWAADIKDKCILGLAAPCLLGQPKGQLPQGQATGVSIEEI